MSERDLMFPLWLINDLEAKGIPGVPVAGRFRLLTEKYYAGLEAEGLVIREVAGHATAAIQERWRMTDAGMERWGDIVERAALQSTRHSTGGTG